MIVDISFVCHLTVIFWYYHYILIYQNIKLTVRFQHFAMLILSWYFDIIKCLLIYLSYAISRWYFDISKYQINGEILLIVSWYFTVIFLYYHDILIHQNIKLTVRFCWYYHDIWYKNHNHHKCVLPRFLRMWSITHCL